MSDVYGVRRTIVVGGRAAAEMVSRKQGGTVVQLYRAGCTLSGQKIKYTYVDYKDGCHTRTIERTVHNVRAHNECSGGMLGEVVIGRQTRLVECWGMDAEDHLIWYARGGKE